MCETCEKGAEFYFLFVQGPAVDQWSPGILSRSPISGVFFREAFGSIPTDSSCNKPPVWVFPDQQPPTALPHVRLRQRLRSPRQRLLHCSLLRTHQHCLSGAHVDGSGRMAHVDLGGSCAQCRTEQRSVWLGIAAETMYKLLRFRGPDEARLSAEPQVLSQTPSAVCVLFQDSFRHPPTTHTRLTLRCLWKSA